MFPSWPFLHFTCDLYIILLPLSPVSFFIVFLSSLSSWQPCLSPHFFFLLLCIYLSLTPLSPLIPHLLSLSIHPSFLPIFVLAFVQPPPLHLRWSIRKPSWPSDLWRSMRSVLRSSISPSRSWKPGSASWSLVVMEPCPRQPFSVTVTEQLLLCCRTQKGERGRSVLFAFLVCVSVEGYLFWGCVCVPWDTELTTQFSSVIQLSILALSSEGFSSTPTSCHNDSHLPERELTTGF